MSMRLYQLERSRPHVLRISWEPGWRNTAVWLDETHLDTIPTARDLAAGHAFALPDGAELCIQISRPYRERDLVVSLNGERLYGTDPALPDVIRVTYQTVFMIGGLLVFFGCIALLVRSEVLLAIGIGPHSPLIGVLFLLLGFFVRHRSLLAVILATVLLGVHWLIGISFAGVLGSIPHLGGTMPFDHGHSTHAWDVCL